MPGKGYIKIHRDAVGHTVFKSALAWQMFTGILMTCDYHTGTLATSYGKLAEMCGILKQHVKRVLDILVEDGCISYSTDKAKRSFPTTSIKVINWSKWQGRCNTTSGTSSVTTCNTTSGTSSVTTCNTTGPTPLPYIQEVKQEEYKQEAAAAAPCACACEKSGGAAEDKPQFETFGGTVTEPYPSTPGEVIQEAERQCLMMTDKQASCFLEDFSGVGWVDRYGRRIVNWRCFVRKWLNGWTEREARKKLYGQGNPNASKAGYGVEMDEEERARRRDFQ